MELLFEFLTQESRLDPQEVASSLWRDHQRGGRHDKPVFLKSYLPPDPSGGAKRRSSVDLPKRQARHLV
jgi:hypothetical protein